MSPCHPTTALLAGKAIIFLTDGRPGWASPKRILQLIADRNAELGNEVMILTYAFGKGRTTRHVGYVCLSLLLLSDVHLSMSDTFRLLRISTESLISDLDLVKLSAQYEHHAVDVMFQQHNARIDYRCRIIRHRIMRNNTL